MKNIDEEFSKKRLIEIILMKISNPNDFKNILIQKIFMLKFQYMHDIENYMMEEHWELRQAATELMCNMSLYSETVKWFEDEKYDRLKVNYNLGTF